MCTFFLSPARALLLALAPFACGLAVAADPPGILDQPLDPDRPVNVERLQAEVQQEQEALETLDRGELEERAESGERVASVALGADFAKEATLLAFAPAAANDALADAARWYSLAAGRGFPGAPSLDQAGVRFYPIRIQREDRPG